jgi:predicted phage baseplate assembly protein
MLKTRSRAVTEEDFEFLAMEASSSVARARCIQPREITATDGPPPGVILLLIIPLVAVTQGRIPPEQLELSEELKQELEDYLDERRLLTSLVIISEPTYVWVSVEAKVKIKQRSDPGRVRADIEKELCRFINPILGGPEGKGWPFGRELILSEIYSHIQRVDGVEYVEEARMYPVELSTGKKGAETQRLALPRTGVLCSHEHTISVEY